MASAILYSILAVVVGTLGLAVEFLAALFLIPALVVGPVVVVGGVAGVVLVGLFEGSLGPWTVVAAAEFTVLVGAVVVLWGRAGLVEPGVAPTMDSGRQVAEYLLTLAVGAVSALAAVGWLVVILGTQPYYTGYGELLTATVLAAMIVPPTLYWLGRDAPASGESATGVETGGSLRRTAAVFVVAAGWFVAGTGVATVAHDFGQFPNRAALSASVADTFGTGTVGQLAFDVIFLLYRFGDVVVVAIGLVALVLLALAWPIDWRRALMSAGGER